MSQIGSFALLLALALCAYSFLAGLLALVRERDASSARLSETARRAGVAAFADTAGELGQPGVSQA